MEFNKSIFISREETEEQAKIANKLAQKPGKRFAVVKTFGCQQNEADSEQIAGICEKCGYEITDDAEIADLIIVNTCAIREHAEQRALSGAGQYRRLKEQNPNLIIAVCGCMVEQEYRRAQIYKSYPYIDFIFGTDRATFLPSMIEKAANNAKRFSVFADRSEKDGRFGQIGEGLPTHRDDPYRAWLSIMYGCNNFCTYCVVPFVRGRERSRDFNTVVEDARRLIDSGCREITLLGQNVNSYDGGRGFPALVESILSLPGDFRLRFMTSHPKDASKELIDVMSQSEKAARHFHLPVQSGSNRVLSRMNRRYTVEKYLETAAYIREKMPDIAITSDIICGFPGETEEDFEQTVNLCREVKYDMLYTFLYSPRPGSAAYNFPDRIPHDEQVRRFEYLSETENEIALKINQSYVGKTLTVLPDGKEPGVKTGRCSQNKTVAFDRPIRADEVGKFIKVKIESAQPYALTGKITD